MTVRGFAQKYNLSERTVYRMIERGEIDGRKVGGKWTISPLGEMSDRSGEVDKLLIKAYDEIEYLRAELTKANEAITDMAQRHDTIVMQLTKQLEHHQLMIEDMRNRSIWTRLKTALGFASA